MKKHVLCLVVVLAVCLSCSLLADDVYLLRDDGKVNNVDVRSFETAGNWSNAEAPSAAHDYYVVSNRSLRITSGGTAHIFKGNSLTIGGTGNGNNFKGQIMGWGGQANVTISNLVVYQSTIQCNNEGWFYLRGKMTVRDTATGDRIFTGINQNTNGGRNFDFLGTVVTTDGESPKVKLTHGKNAANTYTTFKMSCDLTDSRAWFEVTGQNNGLAIFLLDTATFGLAFDSVNTNAIQLLKNSKFVLTANGVQNANLGISVPAAQTAYFGTRTYSASGNCSGTQYDYPDYDLTLPVFGSGTFTKEDDGRITLRNDWSGFHGTLAIEGGSLVLTDDMTASSDMRVVVKAGGALETERTDGTYGDLDVTFEAGAGLIVPYNAEMGVASPITLGASFLEAATFPVGLKLSQSIAFPVNATNRLAVAKVDSAVRVVTGADFTDTTAKTYDLPRTWFEVVTDGTGMQTVYLVVKPVLVHGGEGTWMPFDGVFLRDGSSSQSSLTANYVWSDHLASHPGADYIHTGSAISAITQGGVGSRATIEGDMLVLASGSIASRSEHIVLPYVLVASTNLLFSCAGYAANSRHKIEGGPIHVSAASTTPLEFRSQTENDRTLFRKVDLLAPLEGPGSVLFRTYAPPNDAYISCESPNFKGILIVDASSGLSAKDGLSLHIGSQQALGGRPDTYESRGIQLRGYSCIAPTVSMTLDSSLNRGLVISEGNGALSGGGFDVPSNVVLTLTMNVIQNGTLLKKGPGTLVIGSNSHTYGGWGADVVNGTNNVVEVRAGGVTTMKTTNIDKLCYTFKDGGGIAVFQTPPNATQEAYGLYSTFTHERAFAHEAPIRVKLVQDEPSTPPTSRFSRTICTIPQALNPKTDFAVDKPWDGWRGEVTRADDTPSASMYRYTVTYRPVGMTILFR